MDEKFGKFEIKPPSRGLTSAPRLGGVPPGGHVNVEQVDFILFFSKEMLPHYFY